MTSWGGSAPLHTEMGVLKTEIVDSTWEGRTTSPSLAAVVPKLLDPDCVHPYHPAAHHQRQILMPMPTKTEMDLGDEVDGQAPLCAGCRLRIVDKFYLCAVERKWHSACLKCAECGSELENEASCFEKEGNIYCRDDYLRLYGGPRECARCRMDITPTDLVMKARNCIFHVDCFRCATCDSNLRKGDLFGMWGDVLYCRLHSEMVAATYGPHDPLDLHPSLQSPAGSHATLSPGQDYPESGPMDMYPPGFGPPPPHPGMLGVGPPPPGAFPGGPPDHWPYGPGPDFGHMPEYQYNNNNEPIKKRRGRKKRKVDDYAAINGYMEGYPGGLDGHGLGQAKTKRARTSFKHHQLRIMKAHFQINQNPDSRELKMLSQKTGLDKKVLQVWFQNARAKWRRMNAQGGASMEAVLASGDDDMKGEDVSPEDCGSGTGEHSNMISCC